MDKKSALMTTDVNIKKLILSILICEGAGIVGSIFTIPAIGNWYTTLVRPSFAPPNWIFGPVWTLLFLMMGISFYFVWNKDFKTEQARKALYFFVIQLTLNILWSVLFFGLNSPYYALLEIVLLWGSIILTIENFYSISRKAALLLAPYILWVSFAGILNLFFWQLNF